MHVTLIHPYPSLTQDTLKMLVTVQWIKGTVEIHKTSLFASLWKNQIKNEFRSENQYLRINWRSVNPSLLIEWNTVSYYASHTSYFFFFHTNLKERWRKEHHTEYLLINLQYKLLKVSTISYNYNLNLNLKKSLYSRLGSTLQCIN